MLRDPFTENIAEPLPVMLWRARPDMSCEYLSRQWLEFTGASADEALNALENVEFDLVISDIGMPKTDGYELIRQIRKQEEGTSRKIPAVALTAYARVQDRMQAIMAGFNTHVAKPVEANELITVVASLVGRMEPQPAHQQNAS